MTENEQKLLEWVLENQARAPADDTNACSLMCAVLAERVSPECFREVSEARDAYLKASFAYKDSINQCRCRYGDEQVDTALAGMA